MTTATDIAALKARCTALEKRATATEGKTSALSTAATALTARVAKLEAVKPIDYSAQIAALQKEVDDLRYIISPTPSGPPYGSFNVMDYGAHANGSTDDAAHIQSAIDACYNAGGGTVYIPAGSYWVQSAHAVGSPLINLNMEVKSGVHILGAGIGQTIIASHGIASCSVFGCTDKSDFGVSGMSIIMDPAVHHYNPATGLGGDGDGVKIQRGLRGAMSNLYISGAYIASNCMGSQDITYDNVTMYNASMGFSLKNNDEWANSYTNNITCTNCAANGTISGNYALNSSDYGFRVYNDDNTDGLTNPVHNVTLIGCTVQDHVMGGFLVRFAEYPTLTNCTATGNTGFGYYFNYATHYAMSGCTASGNGYNELPYDGGNNSTP